MFGASGPDDLVVQDVAFGAHVVARARPAARGRRAGPGWTNGKWPKSVKFSTWRDESQSQRYGPQVRPPPVRLELGDVRQRPARLLERDPDDPVALLAAERRARALAGTRVGSASCGIAVQAPLVPYRQPW